MKLESFFLLVYISIAHIGWSKSINLFKLYNNLTNQTINTTTTTTKNTTQPQIIVLWPSKNATTENSLVKPSTSTKTAKSNITTSTTTSNTNSSNITTLAANATTTTPTKVSLKIVTATKATKVNPSHFLLASLLSNQNSNNETDSSDNSTSSLVYRPKEVDELIDYEIETLEAMRHIERNASSKSVLNLFKLMDNDRDGKLSFEEIVKFLNYEYE